MSKYSIRYSSQYKKDRKALCADDLRALDEVVEKLANAEVLEPKYKDHALIGDFKGFRDCHIKPNLLLIYAIIENELELLLVRTGSHQKVFGS